MSMNHKQINIRKETIAILSELKHPGQSFDGVIKELIAEKKPMLQV